MTHISSNLTKVLGLRSLVRKCIDVKTLRIREFATYLGLTRLERLVFIVAHRDIRFTPIRVEEQISHQKLSKL
jgi:hypothetical protein